MIEGVVDERGVPTIDILLAGRRWIATIDTGFNGHFELPEELRYVVRANLIGESKSLLAGGHVIVEEVYEVVLEFDGELRRAHATFAPGDGILLGTRMLMAYRLTIEFPDRRVWLERV